MLCFCYFTLLAITLSAGSVCPPDFQDTGQVQNGAVLSVKGSVDGSPVVLKGQGVPVLPYCAQASPICTLECTVTFATVHSPMYYINGSCFSAGGSTSVMELQEIGVIATHAHPKYLVKFPCHGITKYTCYMNATVYTEVEVRPDASACIVPPQPTVATTDNTPPGSDGNSSVETSFTGNSTTGNSTTEISTNGSTIPTTVPHHPFSVFTAGLIVGVFLIVFFTAIAAIVLLIAVLHRDQFKTQGQRVLRRLCPCCPQGQVDVEAGQVDLGSVEATVAAHDNGNHEMVAGVSSPPDGGGVQAAISVVRSGSP